MLFVCVLEDADGAGEGPSTSPTQCPGEEEEKAEGK